jgi:hypothetical protein
MRWLLDTLGGLYQLCRLAVITRFDFKGPYWTWRIHTAFGPGNPQSRAWPIRSVLDYARWAHRIRRGL